MIGYVPGRGILYSLHPFSSLGVAVALSIVAVVAPTPVGPLATLGAAVLVLVLGGAWGGIRPALVLTAPFWLFLLVIHWGVRGQPEVAVVIAARLSAIIVVFTAAVTTVHPGRLVEGLVQIRAPFGVAYLLSATFQAIPRLTDHARCILETQQCRGLSLKSGILGRSKALIPLAVPLVLGALVEVDERASALETRGASAGARRTSLNPPPWCMRDSLIVSGSILSLFGAVVWRLG